MIDRLEEVAGVTVSRGTMQKLELYGEALRNEAAVHNLVSKATLNGLWERHILDSAQLARLAPAPNCSWVDVGSGAGLPGMVIANLVEGQVSLIEPRRLRADFLERTVLLLGLLGRVRIIAAKAERVEGCFDVITGRAVASVARFLSIAQHLSTDKTLWVLPKGRKARSELDEARRSWHCDATIVPSCTDPDSEILLLRHVRAKGTR